MKKALPVIVVLAVVVVAVVGYFVFAGKKGGPELVAEFAAIKESKVMPEGPSEEEKTPLWEKEIPEGTKLVEGDAPPPKLNVVASRRNEGPHSLLEFQVSEEHGYMVDGILLQFWYHEKDAETGEWIEDSKRIGYFVKKRLGFNETVVDSTPLLDVEFQHLGIDLSATTTENWLVSVASYARAMMPDDG